VSLERKLYRRKAKQPKQTTARIRGGIAPDREGKFRAVVEIWRNAGDESTRVRYTSKEAFETESEALDHYIRNLRGQVVEMTKSKAIALGLDVRDLGPSIEIEGG
jgi:hypothetical protein